MKKGLLTVLLASLVLVGCQNYDDQFDDLNAQISALKSQVDGLSSLSGQVSSLSGTISGLQSGIAAAQAAATAAGSSADAATAAVNAIPGVDLSGLTASLATLQAEVDAIEAAIATTATAAEVAALQTSLTAVETDLADLLTSNNVYATAITVNSAASMASALALGNKVALMNASVTITDDATISDTDIQTFVNRIKTMNGTFTYSSGSATGFTPTFDEMVAATAIALTPAGPVSFKKLASATTVTITTTYSTKITSLDMGALASVTSFNTGSDDQLHLSSATNVDLGELARYGASLSIQTKKGATLDIAKLDDKGTTGLQSDIALTLNGPASVNLSLIADGTITLSNVAEATVSAFYGVLDVDSGVETLTTTDSVTIHLDGATDLVTATLDYKYDWDPALSTAAAAVADDLSNQGYLEDYEDSASIGGTDLKTLTISGELLDLYLDEANLETLTLTGVTMHGLTISGMDDLTTLSVASGNKIGDITLENSDNLTVANFDHTTNLDAKAAGTTAPTGTAAVETGVNFIVTDNLGLTKLHTTGDSVDTFTVTGNDALAELDMTGLDDFGTTTEPSFALYDNDLTATKGNDTWDGETATTTTGADGGTADAGSWDDGTSGMDTMKLYLTAMAAEADADGYAGFDTVSTFDNTDLSETATVQTSLNVLGPTTYTAGTTDSNDSTVLEMIEATPNDAAGAKGAIAEKAGFIITPSAGSNDFGTIQFTYDGTALFDTTVNGAGTAVTLNGANKNNDVAALESAINVQRAANAGLTLDAKRGGNSSHAATLRDHVEAATAAVIGERYTTATAAAAGVSETNYGLGSDDYVTMTLGSNSVTATAASATELAAQLYTAWAAKYGSGGTASATAIATMNSPTTGTGSSQAIAFTMLQTDSGGYNVDLDFAVTVGTTTATNGNNIDWTIGSTNNTTDNGSVDSSIILTLESTDTTGATPLTSITTAITNATSITAYAMTTNYRTNTDGTGINTYAYTSENRTDVRAAEDSVDAATSTAVAQTLFNRVTWLG